jgi:hypothetical protein
MSMEQMLDDFERIAVRCRRTAKKVEDLLLTFKSLPPETALEGLTNLGRETDEALQEVRERVVPKIQAIQSRRGVDLSVRLRCTSIVTQANSLYSQALRIKAKTVLSESLGDNGQWNNDDVFSKLEPLRQYVVALASLPDGIVALSAVAEDLALVAAHFRVQLAFEPKQATPTVVHHSHHGDIVESKYATNIHGSTVGGIALGDHGQVHGSVGSPLESSRATASDGNETDLTSLRSSEATVQSSQAEVPARKLLHDAADVKTTRVSRTKSAGKKKTKTGRPNLKLR